MQGAEQREGDSESRAVHQDSNTEIRARRRKGAKQSRKGRFSEGAESQAGQRNAKLHGGNHAVQLTQQNLHDASADVSFANQLAHARQTHCDQRELRRSEKAIERDERQHAQDANGEHYRCG
jgi:hypothetical protein